MTLREYLNGIDQSTVKMVEISAGFFEWATEGSLKEPTIENALNRLEEIAFDDATVGVDEEMPIRGNDALCIMAGKNGNLIFVDVHYI